MRERYTEPECQKCESLKDKYITQGLEYIERDEDRLKNPAIDRDDIDVEAFIQISMQNMVLPVEVNK